MKKILILLIGILCCSIVSAQKYTDQYISDANKAALNWLSNINNNDYKSAYILLSKECKIEHEESRWIAYIEQLMKEFGNLENRTVTDKYFQSNIDKGEDGFYVFITYSSKYKNKGELTETIIVKQNYKLKWKIYDYKFSFISDYEENEMSDTIKK